ncbi:MAG: VWA domain-containing protein [Acidobacteria bacterium]|nr:VWA domain-containing protein [Acidobacteriota bacterium]
MHRSGQQFRVVRCALFLSVLLILALTLPEARSASGTPAGAESQNQQQKEESIPDAPSAVQPPPKPLPENETRPQLPASEPAPRTESPPQQPAPAAPANSGTSSPPINIRTVPAGGETKDSSTGQEDFFRLYVTTNQVMVPVTVKDESGHLVSGLSAKDFTLLENGKKQTLNFFTSDPFALSAAVVLDLGMKDVDLQKVNHTFPALEGAFSQFDELSLFAYNNTVGQLSGWQAAGQQLSATLDQLKPVRGLNNGPPVTSGPLGPQGPMVNNMPVDPAAPIVYTPPQEARVLNDAILQAAVDLAKRDKTRRKVIFVVSDGREYRSNASYRDVLRVLLSNNITVYAVGVGGAAIPGYNKLEKMHLPRFGFSDILPKYVNATGGQVFDEMTRAGIETAYTEAMADARNQYTMGYLTHAAPTGTYRDLEVLVDRPSCKSSIRPCVNVWARAGYYPTPSAR